MNQLCFTAAFAAFFICTNIIASTEQPTKYWKYRERLITRFIAPGLAKGHSLIGSDDRGDYIKFADTSSMQGWYLSTLATEYAILKRDGQQTRDVEVELYWAIQAINRLDDTAEPFYGGVASRNGFFIRDDADVDLAPKLGVEFIQSDYVWGKENPGINEMSVDQYVDMLMGLAFIKRYVDVSVEVNGKSLVRLAQDIALRIYQYIRKDDWIIPNPVTGKWVERGPGAKGLSWGLYHGARYVLDDEQDKLLGLPNWKTYFINSWARTGLIPLFHNRGMILMLATIGNLRGGRAPQRMARWYGLLYTDKEIFSYVHASLYKKSLGGKRRQRRMKRRVGRLLDSAPYEGPKYENDRGWTTWNRFFEPFNYKVKNLSRRGNPQQVGSSFAGIDYMLMHNLYYLVHGESPRQYTPTSKFLELLYRFEERPE